MFKENSYTYPEAATDTKPDIPAAQFLWHYTCYYTFRKLSGVRTSAHVISQIQLDPVCPYPSPKIITFTVYYRIYCTHRYPKPVFVLYFVSLEIYINEKKKKRYEPSAKVFTLIQMDKINKVIKQQQI